MTTSNRGRLIPPNLDDRTWQDLVDEARSLIPKYAPNWTDHNPSDFGFTLIELFAALVEALIYRLNRVPDKTYDAFINLLGITRDPATPARAYLTFTAQPAAVVVPRKRQAQTQDNETEPAIVFETDDDLTVLPTNLAVALLIEGEKYRNVSSRFTIPPASGDTVTVPNGQPHRPVHLCLGFDQSTTAEIRLLVELFQPIQRDPVTRNPLLGVSWVYSNNATVAPTSWGTIQAGYIEGKAGVIDNTEGLQHNGIVRFTLPLAATWTSQVPTSWASGISFASVSDQVANPYFWVGIRIANPSPQPIQLGIRFILFNSISAHNALTIPLPEPLGTGTGKPFQVFPLRFAPLYKRLETDTPYDHLQIQVGGVPWTMVDDIPAGPGNFYKVNPVTAEILFGNHDPAVGTGNGTKPPNGSIIQAVSYRYVAGGMSGNVGAATIKTMRTPVEGIIGVTNLFSADGGSDEEPIEDTKRRAPDVLRIRNRAITKEDYEYLAREATRDVVIVRCLEPRVVDAFDRQINTDLVLGNPWTFAAIDRSPGNVNVFVVPDHGLAVPRPEPTEELLHEVQRYLDARRDVTAKLQVIGPRYLPVKVLITATAWNKAILSGIVSPIDVKLEIENKLRRFLHPVHGASDGRGWQVGDSVFVADVFKAVMPAEEIGFISSMTLEAETPPYHIPPLGPGGSWNSKERPFPLATAGQWVRVADYELVCYGDASEVTMTQPM